MCVPIVMPWSSHLLICYQRIWRSILQTKHLFYWAGKIPATQQASETWTIYSRHLKVMEKYHQIGLHNILQIYWKYKWTNVSAQYWSSTINCIEHQDTRIPDQLYSELQHESWWWNRKLKDWRLYSRLTWTSATTPLTSGNLWPMISKNEEERYWQSQD